MHQHSRRRSSAVLVVGALLVVWAGCREDDPTADDRNRPPDTYLVQAPNWGESGFYVNHIHWNGFDPDGRVDHFEITVTDSFGNLDEAVWQPTFRTDSLVRFPVGGETGQDQVLGNRFYVRAVDNEGRRDLEPAWIFFGARDGQFPEVDFTTAVGESDAFPKFGAVPIGDPERCETGVPRDTVPAGSRLTFIWQGVDRDSLLGEQVGDVTAFEYKMSEVNNSFLGGSLSDTMAVYEGLEPGTYTFTVRTTDDGGLQSEGCRYFQINYDPDVGITRVWDSCKQDSVAAARVGRAQWSDSRDACEGLLPWSYTDEGLPDPPVNPCLPPGYVSVDDTLAVTSDPEAPWWFEFEATASDPDGDVDHLEILIFECSTIVEGNCSPRSWTCAPDTAGAITIGPFTSGNWRAVIVGVDENGQRGTSKADTLDFRVDRTPEIITRTDGLDPDVCDGFLGAAVGDTFQVCDNDTNYVCTRIQTNAGDNDAPCAVATVYAETGSSAPLTVFDYNSFPMEGDTLQLEFRLDNQGNRFAQFCGLAWGRDLDGTLRVGYARWSVDQIPTSAWGQVDPVFQVLPDSTALTPVCFCPVVRQDEQFQDHVLYIEMRDWLQADISSGARVAQRTVRQVINFTVEDITGFRERRYTLPGRDAR